MQFRRNLLRVSILHAGVAVSVGDWCRWPQHRLLHWPFFYAAFYVTLDQKIPWHIYKLKLGFVNLCFGCGHLSKICFTRVSQNTTTTWPFVFFSFLDRQIDRSRGDKGNQRLTVRRRKSQKISGCSCSQSFMNGFWGGVPKKSSLKFWWRSPPESGPKNDQIKKLWVESSLLPPDLGNLWNSRNLGLKEFLFVIFLIYSYLVPGGKMMHTSMRELKTPNLELAGSKVCNSKNGVFFAGKR